MEVTPKYNCYWPAVCATTKFSLIRVEVKTIPVIKIYSRPTFGWKKS
jgi:hypothetical protein